MQEDAKTLEAEGAAEGAEKARKQNEIRLADDPSSLLSKEGFALYVGKTPNAVACMAKAGKLPSFYMADPAKPGGKAELWVSRKEWDGYHDQLVESAPAEWHGWKDRLSANKPSRTRGRKQRAAA